MNRTSRSDAQPPTCPACGYSLAALPEAGRCPECGAAYDPVVLAYVPDATIQRKNRAAWLAVLLPPLTFGIVAAIQARSKSLEWLVFIVAAAVLATLPLARTVMYLAPFHSSARLLGASITGSAAMALCQVIGWYDVSHGFVPTSIERRAMTLPVAILAGPLGAYLYIGLGKLAARRAGLANTRQETIPSRTQS